MQHTMNKQAGFSLLGVLIAVMIVGIMAALAVPKLSSAITTANTSKIKADLATLDTAVGVYTAEKGSAPAAGTITVLSDYVQDATNLKPPAGKCWLNGTEANVPATTYTLTTLNGSVRAICGGSNTVGSFGKDTSSNQSTTPSQGAAQNG